MNTLGIRVKPHAIIIAIYSTDEARLINVEDINIPNAMSTPEALKYIRNNVLDVLREYQIQRAALRMIESNSKTISLRRVEIEGVIQEAFASSILESYFCGQISTLSAKLGIERRNFKKYVDGEISYAAVEEWNELTKEQREAAFAAIGAENA